jgi:hypothetical protein
LSSIELHSNGFLVKRIDSEYAKGFGQYKGIQGDCWPINEHSIPKEISVEETKYLSNFLENNIMLNGSDNTYVDVCPNIYFLKRYINACLISGFKIQVIYCKTQKRFPECDVDQNGRNFKFIGYDYGYSGGDYYSCVYGDVKRIPEMAHFNLNRYGLFNGESEILEFIKLRSELEKMKPHLTFECGDFTIYQLWEYKDF